MLQKQNTKYKGRWKLIKETTMYKLKLINYKLVKLYNNFGIHDSFNIKQTIYKIFSI